MMEYRLETQDKPWTNFSVKDWYWQLCLNSLLLFVLEPVPSVLWKSSHCHVGENCSENRYLFLTMTNRRGTRDSNELKTRCNVGSVEDLSNNCWE